VTEDVLAHYSTGKDWAMGDAAPAISTVMHECVLKPPVDAVFETKTLRNSTITKLLFAAVPGGVFLKCNFHKCQAYTRAKPHFSGNAETRAKAFRTYHHAMREMREIVFPTMHELLCKLITCWLKASHPTFHEYHTTTPFTHGLAERVRTVAGLPLTGNWCVHMLMVLIVLTMLPPPCPPPHPLRRYESNHNIMKAATGRSAQSLAAYISGPGGMVSICKRLATHLEFVYKVEIDSGTYFKAQHWAKSANASKLEPVSEPHGFLPHNMVSDIHIFPASATECDDKMDDRKELFLQAWRLPSATALEAFLFDVEGGGGVKASRVARTIKAVTSMLTSFHLIGKDVDGSWRCSCVQFGKTLVCKHCAAIGIKMGTLALPDEYNSTRVGQSKRLPGRPRKRPATDGDDGDDGTF
jgi:hypothetical protein